MTRANQDIARGLHETLMTDALTGRLGALDPRTHAYHEPLLPADAPDRIALHMGRVIARVLADVPERERVARGVALARELIALIDAQVADVGAAPESPTAPGSVLRALVGRLPDGTPEPVPMPSIPLLDTLLLTNAPGEPRVGHAIPAEGSRPIASTC
jgi:hypothetical protein